VNKAESDQIVNGLKKRGIDVEYMVKENEGHGFHNEENEFDFYEAMEKFSTNISIPKRQLLRARPAQHHTNDSSLATGIGISDDETARAMSMSI
jgi:hypothetical protein